MNSLARHGSRLRCSVKGSIVRPRIHDIIVIEGEEAQAGIARVAKRNWSDRVPPGAMSNCDMRRSTRGFNVSLVVHGAEG